MSFWKMDATVIYNVFFARFDVTVILSYRNFGLFVNKKGLVALEKFLRFDVVLGDVEEGTVSRLILTLDHVRQALLTRSVHTDILKRKSTRSELICMRTTGEHRSPETLQAWLEAL